MGLFSFNEDVLTELYFHDTGTSIKQTVVGKNKEELIAQNAITFIVHYFSIVKNNEEKMELQLQRDYKTSHLCKRFRLIAFILFHIRQKPIVRLTKQSAYNTAILIASLAMIMIMIITIIMTIE
jgi:hypothetical protein